MEIKINSEYKEYIVIFDKVSAKAFTERFYKELAYLNERPHINKEDWEYILHLGEQMVSTKFYEAKRIVKELEKYFNFKKNEGDFLNTGFIGRTFDLHKFLAKRKEQFQKANLCHSEELNQFAKEAESLNICEGNKHSLIQNTVLELDAMKAQFEDLAAKCKDIQRIVKYNTAAKFLEYAKVVIKETL